MKNYFKLLFTFLMAFLVINTVNADATYKVEIKNSEAGHTYEAYQIFTGTLSNEKDILSDIEWGSGVSDSFKSGKDATAYAKLIKADPVAKSIELGNPSNLSNVKEETSNGVETTIDGKTVYVYTISGLVPGYYLIKDKEGSQAGKNDAYTEYIVKLVGDATVSTKTGIPTADKNIGDGTTDVKNSSDYAIGDTVKYTLTGTMPSNYGSYNTYKYIFHDTLSKGLKLEENTVKVYVDGTQITSGWTKNVTEVTDGTKLDIIFTDTKTISSIDKDSVITVKYDATVDTDAVKGKNGNENTLNIEFSNNPNSDETGKTNDVITKVFIFDLILNKIDSETLEALSGAGFTLERTSDNRKWGEIKNLQGNEFKFEGLGTGDYVLTETTVPNGYNKLDPITFTISDDDDDLTSLDITSTGYTFTITVTDTKAELEADIPNVKGIELPLTGGMGSIIFTVIGVSLMALAAVGFLKNKEEK